MSAGWTRGVLGNVAEAVVIDIATGSGFAGVVTVYVTLDSGTETIGSVGAGIAVSKGRGLFQYLPTAAESDATKCSFLFTGSGAIPANSQYFPISPAQSQALQTATGASVITGRDLVTDALLELNVYDAIDTIEPQNAAYVLRKLNRILDNWNAERPAVYADQFNTYTFTPALSPHTIGPTGTWVTTQRPVSIEAAMLLFNTSGNPQVRITMRDALWYASLSIKSLSTQMPTDVFYEPDWPNGKLFFWPIPSAAYQVTLLTRMVLAKLALDDAFTLPPGYQDAITLTLCEDIAPTFEKQVAPSLARKAQEARDRIFRNNVEIPRLVTRDSGMPTAAGGGSGDGTYLSGWWR